jgi:hypothetical protein
VPGAFIDLSLINSGASNATATGFNHFSGFSNEKVNNLPTRFGADNNGQVQIIYTAASPLASGDIDTITAQNHPTATVSNTTTYTYAGTVTTTPAPYTAVTPVRVCDTRPVQPGIASNQCNLAGQGPITANATRNVLVTGGAVPSNATAIVVNLTAIAPTRGTFVTLFPTGGSKPNTSNVNPPAGKVVANLVEVAIGSGGEISVYNNLGTINVALDVEGFVAPASTGLFNPATPTRICDTRAAGPGIAVNQCNSTGANPIGAGGVLNFNVHDSGSPVPSSGVSAVVFNLTAIGPSKPTVLTAYPGGVTRPNASNVNVGAAATVPNRVIVAVPSGCSGNCTVNIWNSVGSVNVAVDIDGWFSTGGGSQFTGLTPARLCDTQSGVGISGCQHGPVAAGHTMSILVDGADGIPPTTAGSPPTALVINVTAVNATTGTFVTVWGPSSAARPNASDLNVPSFMPVTNLVVVEVGADGVINLFNDLGSTNLIVDVLGYYSG